MRSSDLFWSRTRLASAYCRRYELLCDGESSRSVSCPGVPPSFLDSAARKHGFLSRTFLKSFLEVSLFDKKLFLWVNKS